MLSGSTRSTASLGGDPVVTNCGFSNGPRRLVRVRPLLHRAPTRRRRAIPAPLYDTVLGIWDGTGGCGNLVAVSCNDDDPNGCTTGGFFGLESRVSWTATAGTPYYISVAGYAGGTGNFNLIAFSGSGLTLTFTTGGPGSIGYSVVGGAAWRARSSRQSRSCAGAYPTGWFFGIDIGLRRAPDRDQPGLPVPHGRDRRAGAARVGPFPGVPSGSHAFTASRSASRSDRRSRRRSPRPPRSRFRETPPRGARPPRRLVGGRAPAGAGFERQLRDRDPDRGRGGRRHERRSDGGPGPAADLPHDDRRRLVLLHAALQRPLHGLDLRRGHDLRNHRGSLGRRRRMRRAVAARVQRRLRRRAPSPERPAPRA